ncbi:MAG TPA: 4-hydroxy-tetrahydrodipicolinate reductase, partial [Kocuria sp.]|nr:4-hydroxy-tetrahydrodipicolinate reductase [Kocuria sp.]
MTDGAIRVAVLGRDGRMGSEAVRAVEDAADLELVAALGRGDDLSELVRRGAQVVVDLTVPAATRENVRFA